MIKQNKQASMLRLRLPSTCRLLASTARITKRFSHSTVTRSHARVHVPRTIPLKRIKLRHFGYASLIGLSLGLYVTGSGAFAAPAEETDEKATTKKFIENTNWIHIAKHRDVDHFRKIMLHVKYCRDNIPELSKYVSDDIMHQILEGIFDAFIFSLDASIFSLTKLKIFNEIIPLNTLPGNAALLKLACNCEEKEFLDYCLENISGRGQEAEIIKTCNTIFITKSNKWRIFQKYAPGLPKNSDGTTIHVAGMEDYLSSDERYTYFKENKLIDSKKMEAYWNIIIELITISETSKLKILEELINLAEKPDKQLLAFETLHIWPKNIEIYLKLINYKFTKQDITEIHAQWFLNGKNISRWLDLIAIYPAFKRYHEKFRSYP